MAFISITFKRLFSNHLNRYTEARSRGSKTSSTVLAEIYGVLSSATYLAKEHGVLSYEKFAISE